MAVLSREILAQNTYKKPSGFSEGFFIFEL